MSFSELLLTLCVAFMVFSPSKWPMLARHTAKALTLLQQYKQHARLFWKAQLDAAQIDDESGTSARPAHRSTHNPPTMPPS